MPAKQVRTAKKKAETVKPPVFGPPGLRQNMLLLHYSKGKPDLALMLTAEFHKEGNKWLAECLETGTANFGSSFEEAWADFIDALTLQLDGVEKLGFFADYLQEHNIRPLAIVPPKSPASSALAKGWVVPGEVPGELVKV